MAFEKNPTYRLETPLGVLTVSCNGIGTDGSDYLHYETADSLRYPHSAPVGGWDGVAETVRVNGVDYTVSGFVQRLADGTVVHEERRTQFSGALTRVDNLQKGSDAAHKRWEKIITGALTAWFETEQGQTAIREGRRITAHNQREMEVERLEKLLADTKKREWELRFSIARYAKIEEDNA